MSKKRIVIDTQGGISWRQEDVPFSNKLAYMHNCIYENGAVRRRGGTAVVVPLTDLGLDFSDTGGLNYEGYVWVENLWEYNGSIYIGIAYDSKTIINKNYLRHNVGVWKLTRDTSSLTGWRAEKVLDHSRDTAGNILVEKFTPENIFFWQVIDTVLGKLLFTGSKDIFLQTPEGNFYKLFTTPPPLSPQVRFRKPIESDTADGLYRHPYYWMTNYPYGIYSFPTPSGYDIQDRYRYKYTEKITSSMVNRVFIPEYKITLRNEKFESPPTQSVGTKTYVNNQEVCICADPRVKTILRRPYNSVGEYWEIEEDIPYGIVQPHINDKNEFIQVDTVNNKIYVRYVINNVPASWYSINSYYEFWVPSYEASGTTYYWRFRRLRKTTGETKWKLLSIQKMTGYSNAYILEFEGLPEAYDTVGGTWQPDWWTIDERGYIYRPISYRLLDISHPDGVQTFDYTYTTDSEDIVMAFWENRNYMDRRVVFGGYNGYWNDSGVDKSKAAIYSNIDWGSYEGVSLDGYVFAPIFIYPAIDLDESFFEALYYDGSNWHYDTFKVENIYLDETVHHTLTPSSNTRIVYFPLTFRRRLYLLKSDSSAIANDVVWLAPLKDSYGDDFKYWAQHDVNEVIWYRRSENGEFLKVHSEEITYDWSTLPESGDTFTNLQPLIFIDTGEELAAGYALEAEESYELPQFKGGILWRDRVIAWTDTEIWWTKEGQYTQFSPLRSVKIPNNQKINQILNVGVQEYLTGQGAYMFVLQDENIWTLFIDDTGAQLNLLSTDLGGKKGIILSNQIFILNEKGVYTVKDKEIAPFPINISQEVWRECIGNTNWAELQINALKDKFVISIPIDTTFWKGDYVEGGKVDVKNIIEGLSMRKVELVIDLQQGKVYTRNWSIPYEDDNLIFGSDKVIESVNGEYLVFNVPSENGNINWGYILLYNDNFPSYDCIRFAYNNDGAYTEIGVFDTDNWGRNFESFIETHFIPFNELQPVMSNTLWALTLLTEPFTNTIEISYWTGTTQEDVSIQRFKWSDENITTWQEWRPISTPLLPSDYLNGIIDFGIIKMPIQGNYVFSKVKIKLTDESQKIYLAVVETE